LKITWINHRDPENPLAGGAEVRIHEICKRLVKLNCEVRLISERWNGADETSVLDGIELVRVGGRFTEHILTPLLLKKYDDYDVVIDDMAHGIPWFSPIFTRKPVIGQIHQVQQDVFNIELSPYLARFASLSETSIRLFYRKLITVSESAKCEMINRLGISSNNIEVIPNGITIKLQKAISKSLNPTILCLGRLKSYKRIDHVLSAFKIVGKEFPNAQLIIAGDGDALPLLKEMSARMTLSNVFFVGKVSEDMKARLMGSSWVVVSTSQTEGWGMTITESAACGSTAVAYDVPGLRESVKDGVTGLLAENGNIRDLAEKIIEVLKHEGLRERLSRNAFEYSKRFSWNYSAQRFLEVVKDYCRE
jgi:glycosyltransferase involved in cell wall biosynthesis